MNRVLCSTGAIITRVNNRDFTLLQDYVPQLACDGLEFMMYESWQPEPGRQNQLLPLLKVLAAFDVPVFHMTKQIGEWLGQGKTDDALALFRADCALAAALGSKLLVLHLWSGQVSDQHIERNFAAYPRLRDIAAHHGLLLTVENVVCNQRDPMTHMRELVDTYPDIRFTFDTKMAAFHNQLEALYLPENAWLWPRITHFHVNDYAGGYMDWDHLRVMALGQGHIDFDRFFAFVKTLDYQGDFTHEGTALNPDGTVRFGELNESLKKIRAAT